MKVVALLVQPLGMDVDVGEMADRFPGVVPVTLNQFPEMASLVFERSGGLVAWIEQWAAARRAALPAGTIGETGSDEDKADGASSERPKSLRDMEREFLQRVLAEHNGNKSLAAKSLKIHRRTLQRKLSRLS